VQGEIGDRPAEPVVGEQGEALAPCSEPLALVGDPFLELVVADRLATVVERRARLAAVATVLMQW